MRLLVAVLLLALWGLGMVTSNTGGGLINGLLVIALVIVFERIAHYATSGQKHTRGDGRQAPYKKPR